MEMGLCSTAMEDWKYQTREFCIAKVMQMSMIQMMMTMTITIMMTMARKTEQMSSCANLQENPEKFKIATFHQETDGRMFAVPQGRRARETIEIICPTHRGHALHGDKVLVEIIEAADENDEDDAPPEDERVCGKVDGVINRSEDIVLKKMVCCIDPYCDDIMVPLNRTYPKMFILGQTTKQNKNKNVTSIPIYNVTAASTRMEPHCMYLRNVDVPNSCRAQKLFLVRYLEWYHGKPYPLGIVTEGIASRNYCGNWTSSPQMYIWNKGDTKQTSSTAHT